MPRIDDLKAAHDGEWLAVRVTREEDDVPVEGDLLFHSKDPEEVSDWAFGQSETLYVTFAGPPVPEGTEAIF